MIKYLKIVAIITGLIIYTAITSLTFAQINEAKPDIIAEKTTSGLKFFLEEQRNFIARKYILGPNDVMDISFLGVPELDQKELRVQPDGSITIPLLGTFNVAGLTIKQLNEHLAEKYRYYLIDPQLSINLIETKPFIFYVSGAVINPGSYEIETNTSNSEYIDSPKAELRIIRKTPLLSNILVAAGGVSADADLEHIKIRNTIENVELEVNLFDLLVNGDSNQDIYLMSGDVIDVPKLPTPLAVNMERYKKYAGSTFSPSAVPVKVLGYVNAPGLIFLNASRSLNLNSAIAASGGYQGNAPYPPSKIYLSRIDNNNNLVTTAINPMKKDVELMPNDIIYVPDKARPIIGRAFDYLTRIIAPANSFASTYNNWALMFNPKRYQVNVLDK